MVTAGASTFDAKASSSSTKKNSSSFSFSSSAPFGRKERRGRRSDGLKTSAFFDDLKQKASQVLEKSRDESEESGGDGEEDLYPEESTDYDDENANPFKTMLQKGMKNQHSSVETKATWST